MDNNNSILKTELESLKSKLSSSSGPPSVVKSKSSIIVTVNVRKSLALRFKLAEKSWLTIVESAKLYAAEYVNLKAERVSAIREFVKRVNSMIDAHASGVELSGYVLSQAYEKCTTALVGEDYLLESLDVIESRSKSCVFVFDEDEEIAASTTRHQDVSRSNKKSRNSRKEEEEEDNEEKKTQKFKGSEFIFQRIKWDEKIDKSQVVIGYLDRFLGVKEIRFDEFKGVHEDKEGVPLHRIRYFKINDRIVWDREQKIDLLSGSGDSVSEFFEDSATASRLGQVTIDETLSSVFVDGSVFEFCDNEWSTTTNNKPSQTLLGGEFSLLTYNLMSKVNFKKSILSKMNFKKSQTEVTSRALDGLDNEVDEELGVKQFEKIDRMGRVLEAMRESAWHVMALQECDEHEESRLREDEFIRENYFICSLKRGVGAPHKIEHPNCVILSKTRPVVFKLLPLAANSNKYALICKFNSPNGRILLANIHLSSNKAKNFADKRKLQLETLKRYVVDQSDEFDDLIAEHYFVCGDFNFGDSTPENEAECALLADLFEKNGFRDLAVCSSSHSGTCTFDPEKNFAAAITAFNTQPRRLDRVLYKSKITRELKLTSAHLVNTAPFRVETESIQRTVAYQPYLDIRAYTRENRVEINNNGKTEIKCDCRIGDEYWMHPSDHYGIELKFSSDTQKQNQITKNEDTSPKLVYKSALAIIAPSHVAGDLIQPIRHKYDPQVNRWPPHFNLLYPFFKDIRDDENHEDFAKVFTSLARFAPFKCDLERLSVFENNGVVFLEPSPASAQNMKAIYDQLVGIFTADPKKLSQAKWKKGSLTPHMTIAQPTDKRRVEKKWARETKSKIESEFKLSTTNPIASFTVDCVYWIRRDETSPFRIEQAFPLGARYPSIRVGLSLNDPNISLLRFMIDKGLIPASDDDDRIDATCARIIDSISKAIKSIKSTSSSSSSSGNSQIRLEWKNENESISLLTCGSFMHGIKCNDLDLALVVKSKLADDQLGANLAYELAQNDQLFHVVRNIADANIPIIELCLKSESLEAADLQLHTIDYFEDDESLFYSNFQFMKQIESRCHNSYGQLASISGIFENQTLKTHVRNYKDYQVVTSFVRFWAKSRCLYGKAFGYLGGISWSILVAYFLNSSSFTHELELANTDTRFVRLVSGFFEFYSRFEWSRTPVTLVDVAMVARETGRYQQTSPMMIHQCVFPFHNTSRNVNDKSRRLIRNELVRAADILKDSINNTNLTERLELACKKLDESDLPSRSKMAFRIDYNNRNDLNHLFVLIKAKTQGLITSLLRVNPKLDFRPLTNLIDSSQTQPGWSQSTRFYILIASTADNESSLLFSSSSERQLVVDLCHGFINNVRSLAYCSDYTITLEFEPPDSAYY